MGLSVNVRLLREEPLHLVGELAKEEWAADYQDELVLFASPLKYDLEVELQGENIFIRGPLSIQLTCTCGRCLVNFSQTVTVRDFAAFIPLQGEDKLMCEGDIGDLTPLLREDMYLSLPANPVCNPECRGLAQKVKANEPRPEEVPNTSSTAWAALDRLKLD